MDLSAMAWLVSEGSKKHAMIGESLEKRNRNKR